MGRALAGRRVGWLLVGGGGLLALAIQLLAPVGLPLYDGVVVQEPYRYLHPTGQQLGDPSAYTATPALDGGASPVVVAATTEQPPQAQLIAMRDAFVVTPGATALKVSVTPVEPPSVAPPSGTIVGNVYRVMVTDLNGQPLQVKPCDGCLSLVLRAPEGVTEATMVMFASGAWSSLKADHGVGLYSANPTQLGDFALVAGGSAAGGIDPALIIIVALAAVVVVVALDVLVLRRLRKPAAEPRRPPRSGSGGAGGSTRIPSKRRTPRRPSSRGSSS